MKKFLKSLKSATSRLTLSYLVIIMLMSIGFSVVFYNTSLHQLGRQLPPSSLYDGDNGMQSHPRPQVDAFFQQRISEGRHELLQRLVVLNLLALVAGGGLSYYLARRTLEPIESSMEAQSQFVSDASHELRTPLTAMQTVNEVALRREKLTLPDARTIIEQNIEEVLKLKALTDGLLALARQDASATKLSEVWLQDVASEAMNRVVGLAQARKIAVDDKIGKTKVMGDNAALARIVVILLDNAIKYSPPGSTIRLTSSVKGRAAFLRVRDSGPGIRPYDQRRIFDRFYRADQSRGKQVVEGHGIGLSLASKLASQIGAELSVSSTVGKGSVFSIKVPLA